jgi:hypothetical protein
MQKWLEAGQIAGCSTRAKLLLHLEGLIPNILQCRVIEQSRVVRINARSKALECSLQGVTRLRRRTWHGDLGAGCPWGAADVFRAGATLDCLFTLLR